MYEFAGSKSAKLVVQKIREISSPFLFSLLFAFGMCRYIINLHTEAHWFPVFYTVKDLSYYEMCVTKTFFKFANLKSVDCYE
jgi:hypothetical protein